MKKKLIEKRIKAESAYIIIAKSTIRDTAKHFGVSKSTTERDFNKLKEISSILYKEVRKVIDINKEERYMRGGAVTSKLYKEIREGHTEVI